MSNEKAIEIFNPTTSAVNLSVCSIRRYSNGAPVGMTEEGRLMRATGANVLNSQNANVVANPDATLVGGGPNGGEKISQAAKVASKFTATASS